MLYAKGLGYVIYNTIINYVFIVSAKVKDKFLIITSNYSIPGDGINILRRLFPRKYAIFSDSL